MTTTQWNKERVVESLRLASVGTAHVGGVEGRSETI